MVRTGDDVDENDARPDSEDELRREREHHARHRIESREANEYAQQYERNEGGRSDQPDEFGERSRFFEDLF